MKALESRYPTPVDIVSIVRVAVPVQAKEVHHADVRVRESSEGVWPVTVCGVVDATVFHLGLDGYHCCLWVLAAVAQAGVVGTCAFATGGVVASAACVHDLISYDALGRVKGALSQYCENEIARRLFECKILCSV